jgi:hypothetical protein
MWSLVAALGAGAIALLLLGLLIVALVSLVR